MSFSFRDMTRLRLPRLSTELLAAGARADHVTVFVEVARYRSQRCQTSLFARPVIETHLESSSDPRNLSRF